jgi:dienelactone hydrolase
MTKLLLASVVTAVLLQTPVHGPYGHGDAQVWVLRPTGQVRAVVIFGHGWKVAPPSRSYPWVGQFRPWLDHLTAEGVAVVFPRYQLGGDTPGAPRAVAYRTGVTDGLRRLALRPGTPVVAMGYSYGATLALTYAANARSWQLPTPRAVDAVFPAGEIPGVPLPALPPSTDVLIQVGDRDTNAGPAGASAFWAWLARHPAAHKRYQVVRSHGSFVADHPSPKSTTADARAAFWTPLDHLIARAQR